MSSQSRKAAKRYTGTIAHAATVNAVYGPMAGAVYTVLARHCDWVSGVCYLTILQIASMIGPRPVSERHVQRVLEPLVRDGIVGRVYHFRDNRQRANEWTLFVPALWERMKAQAKASAEAALRKLQAKRAEKRERLAALEALRGDMDVGPKASQGYGATENSVRVPSIAAGKRRSEGGDSYRQLMLAGLERCRAGKEGS